MNMKQFGFINIVLVFIFLVTLISFGFFKVINKDFKSVSSTLEFFSNANVYNNASNLLTLEIQNNYPKRVKNNFILLGLANKLVDFVVTPGLVEKAAKPALSASFAFANAPTAIVNKKVIIETQIYKDQAKNTIGDLGLPKFLAANAKLIVDAAPSSLTLVNLDKRPNSVFAMIIKARTILQNNRKALVISQLFLIAMMLLIVINNLHQIRRALEVLWMGLGVAGVFVVGLSALSPWLMQQLMPTGDAITIAQNSLIGDSVSYLLSQVQQIAIVYLVIAVICFALWKFIKFDKTQKKLDRFLHRHHVPRVTVKVSN